jgi:uncharacterized protein (UPF0276 family)
MIKVGLPISLTAVDLLQQGRLDIDYIVWYGQIGLKRLDEVVALKPTNLHDLAASFWLNYEDPFQAAVMEEARAMLDLTRPPWFSTGIGASAEPQAHRDGPYREADKEQLQSRETVIANIIRHGKHLVEWCRIPVLLENFNYHPTNAYDYICEPELFTDLLTEVGADMLLDLAHARISANNMGYADDKAYLQKLPLHKVREVHLNRPGWEDLPGGGKQRVDLHQPLEPEDLDLLGWVLDNTPAEAVTIEIEEIPADGLIAQVAMMREFLDKRQK